MLNSLRRIVFFAAFLVFSAAFVHAQSSTSRITGTVNDVSGAAIEGATVTLTNEATGVNFTCYDQRRRICIHVVASG